MCRKFTFVGVAALAVIGTCAGSSPAVAAGSQQRCPDGSTFDLATGSCRSGRNVYEGNPQGKKPHLVLQRKLPTSGTPYELHLVESRDQIYLTLAVRKPDGNGPFPVVMMGSGNGNGGFTRVENAMYRLEPMHDEMIKRGYAVAFANYRFEIPQAYNTYASPDFLEDTISGGSRALASSPSLDHNDFIALIQHLQSLPIISKVGTIGVSHSGELQAKAASEITWDAAVPIEGASYEFLVVDMDKAPKTAGVMHLEDKGLVQRISNKEVAMARIRRIRTPFLHMGRDGDHLQGVFATVHEWMLEAGNNESNWVSANHPVHGYGFLYRKADGSYAPDEMQKKFFETWMAFFDRKLKGVNTTVR